MTDYLVAELLRHVRGAGLALQGRRDAQIEGLRAALHASVRLTRDTQLELESVRANYRSLLKEHRGLVAARRIPGRAA